MQNTPGTPIVVGVHVAAQLLRPLPPPCSEQPPAEAPPPPPPPASSKSGAASKRGAPAEPSTAEIEPPKPLVTELPQEGGSGAVSMGRGWGADRPLLRDRLL